MKANLVQLLRPSNKHEIDVGDLNHNQLGAWAPYRLMLTIRSPRVYNGNLSGVAIPVEA